MTASVLSVVRPKEPLGAGWVSRGPILQNLTEYAHCAWHHPGMKLMVISSVEVTDENIGPQYHLSITKGKLGGGKPRRCSLEEARYATKQFGMSGSVEDNHSPVMRSYWMPVAEHLQGYDCKCKDEEAAIIEGDYTWRPVEASRVEG
ncbi:MAG: hypothetical protein K2W88_00080 [Pararheinheimera sp.]|nr:hypothetical protein [Rheinheimera sp.]